MPDLREWLRQGDRPGEVEKMDGVDWGLGLATLAELANEKFAAHERARPALLFDKIKSYPEGRRVAANLVSSVGRLSLTLAMDPALGDFDFIQQWRRRAKDIKAIDPETVKDGSIFENAIRGADIDLLQFPVPRWHELDGGRYIGTDDLVVTRDPDDGWVNVGTYRVMVYAKDRIGLHMSPGKHGRVHRDKYFAAGKPCPVAISFGHHPIYFLVASTDAPYGVSEYAYAGGILGKPVELVAGPLTGLPLPADSELAIEGEVIPGETTVEGPFGEWTGYYASRQNEPVIRVNGAGDPVDRRYPPARSDPLRLSAAAPFERRQSALVPHARGLSLERARRRGRARCEGGLGPSGGGTVHDRARDPPALSRPDR